MREAKEKAARAQHIAVVGDKLRGKIGVVCLLALEVPSQQEGI